jgi:hypothetical protein
LFNPSRQSKAKEFVVVLREGNRQITFHKAFLARFSVCRRESFNTITGNRKIHLGCVRPTGRL